MWNVNSAVIVSIVITANGLMTGSLYQHLSKTSLGDWI